MSKYNTSKNLGKMEIAPSERILHCCVSISTTLKSLISMEFFLFFLRKISQLHALLEPPRLFIFGEKSHLHDY